VMRWPVILSLVFALCHAASAAAQSAGFALIVTNNRSQSTTRPDLHYADDDGVQYATLFEDLFGSEHVTLLTQLDGETAALHPQVQARAPTHENLDAAVQQLVQRLHAAQTAGLSTVVYLVFAGHGDLDRGQGYLDLADGRLTAQELEERVIKLLPADRIHLVLDSCNSYFLLNPRKPGGKRWQSQADVPRDLLAKYPRLGAILSTSAEAVTYEWSELQSGVFSYEVRAGLRGAADVDGDGRITYAELAGFIRVANRPIVNDLYRPKVFSKGPTADGDSAVFAQLPAAGKRRLRLDANTGRRLTLRDPQGVRVMDIHQEAGTPFSLTLPSGVALHAQEQIPSAERPQWVEREIPEGEHALSTLTLHPMSENRRGEPPLFGMLFSDPFGKRAFEQTQADVTQPDEPPSGVTQRDVERLRLHLSLTANTAKANRMLTGLTWLVFVAVPMGALTYSIAHASGKSEAWEQGTGIATGLTLTIAGLSYGTLSLAASSAEEKLYTAFSKQDLSTESARSREVPRYERALKTYAEDSMRKRKLTGWLLMAAAVATALKGVGSIGMDAVQRDPIRVEGPLNLVLGVGEVIFSAHMLSTNSRLMDNWLTYSRDPAVQQRQDDH
jgi:hypothetical protein